MQLAKDAREARSCAVTERLLLAVTLQVNALGGQGSMSGFLHRSGLQLLVS